MLWITKRLVLALLFVTTAGVVVVAQEGEDSIATVELLESDCPDVWQDFCARESNRYCYLDDNDDKKCGSCLPGFVDWQARCLSQREVDIVRFLAEYAPQYLKPISQEERLRILLEVIAFIEEHQNQNPPPTYELGLTEFSADTEEDIKNRQGFTPNITIPADQDADRSTPPLVQSASGPPPPKVDWVEQGAVTTVKDQGRCGCCWAVTAAGAVEGAVAVNTGYLQSLSWQQFISCDDENFGCNGGNLVFALTYAVRNVAGGIATLFDYEYTDYQGQTTEQCDVEGRPLAVVVEGGNYVVDYYDNLSFQERMAKMKAAVAVQPVAIVIKSACATISNYRSGVITEDEACACNGPLCADHAVLLVGYDDTASPPYWKIKNSWSTRWGEDGYFRVAQTEKGPYGLFGVLLHGVVPQMAFNTTGIVAEPGSGNKGGGFDWWVYLLIGVGGLAAICCLCACLCGRKK